MKKVFYSFIIVLFAISCEGPMGPPGPPGGEGDESAYWRTEDFIIDKWYLSKSGDFFYASFPVDALSQFIYDAGIVTAYIEIDRSYKTPLPYTRFYRAPSADNPDEDYIWSELIDFTFKPGSMTFHLRPSDFFIEEGHQPATARIRAIFIW